MSLLLSSQIQVITGCCSWETKILARTVPIQDWLLFCKNCCDTASHYLQKKNGFKRKKPEAVIWLVMQIANIMVTHIFISLCTHRMGIQKGLFHDQKGLFQVLMIRLMFLACKLKPALSLTCKRQPTSAQSQTMTALTFHFEVQMKN